MAGEGRGDSRAPGCSGPGAAALRGRSHSGPGCCGRRCDALPAAGAAAAPAVPAAAAAGCLAGRRPERGRMWSHHADASQRDTDLQELPWHISQSHSLRVEDPGSRRELSPPGLRGHGHRILPTLRFWLLAALLPFQWHQPRSVLREFKPHASGDELQLSDHLVQQHHAPLRARLPALLRYQPAPSVFCPAGCKGVTGDIWGNAKQGYRDTSVLCKAAIHAGVILDELGGQLTLSRKKGITLYESAFANGLHSKRGSLSEKRLVFHKACDHALEAAGFNASSSWHEVNAMGQYTSWAAEQAAFSAHGSSWAADPSSETEWLDIDLGGRKNITGIITKGSSDKYNFYVKSYQVFSKKDEWKNWKPYRSSSGQEETVFEGNADSLQEVSNAFIPPIQARYLRIVPRSWNQRIALKVALQGCQVARLKTLRPYVSSAPKEVPILTSIPTARTPIPGVAINPEKAEYAEPDVVQVSPSSQTAPSTFKPALDEGYTLPLVVNHYDVPGKYHEYAEPLPPEPEYATPFTEQALEATGAAAKKNTCVIKVVPTTQGRAGSPMSPGILPQYDFPAQRLGETPNSTRGEGSHQASIVYTEPQTERTFTPWGDVPTGLTTSPEGHCLQPRDSPLTHIYHEPL
ncbi:uncharacterized protein LOC101940879 isoform X6 [Chrysemys picta bellii]|uniref:uncharacterized protein LOC101940879 isoform X6 n=1 Tax=Chrysemys picta bellii TaxID=8478 RepID=UPI0032B2DC85